MAGTDASYNIAVCLALKYKFVFGRDFVFPFGPLGILTDRFPISVNIWVYILFDLYFLCTLFFILKDIFKRHFNFTPVILLLLSVIIAIYDTPFQRYFWFFLYYLFAAIKEPKKGINIIQAALLSIICFYYKVNLGITAILLFLIAISYIGIRKKLQLATTLVIVCSYILSILLVSCILRVDLKGYIAGSWQLIDAYNDAMFLPAGSEYIVFVWAAVLIIAIIAGQTLYLLSASIRKKEVLKNADGLFIHCIAVLIIFICFKSGFVRIDDSHILLFFKFSGLLIALLFLYQPSGFKRTFAAGCWLAVLAISFWAVNTIPGAGKPYLQLVSLRIFPDKIHEIRNYCMGIRNYPAALAASDKPTRNDINENPDLQKIIGSNSVDIIPSEISRIYFNGLHYDPRPVIQSYSAYNQYLDSLNYQKYISPDAPEYILYAEKSIDDRLPFFDESKTKLALFSHYRVIGVSREDLLLQKKPAPQNLLPTNDDLPVNARLGEDIPVNSSYDLQYSKIFIRYNFWGRLRRLFYQPPSLTMTLTLEDNETMTYRAIPTLLEDGIIVNKFIDTRQEFQLLMQSGSRFCANIKKIRFDQTAGFTGFVNTIKMVNTYYTFPDQPEPQRKADSLGLAAIMEEFNKYKPVLTGSSRYEPDSFQYRLENIRTYGPLIRLRGWAFREKAANETSIAGAVLRLEDQQTGDKKSPPKIFELPSEAQKRQDLVSYFKRTDILSAGFKTTISKSQLPPGTYQWGIILYDTVSRKRWIQYTSQTLLIAPGSPQ